MEDKILLTRVMPENTEAARQQDPRLQLRPQAERERAPDAFQKTQERGRSDSSSWSGASGGGGVWGGRSSHER
jgi:hypothetical protein